MASRSWNIQQALRDLVADEQGTIIKDAPHRVALVYPSPYRAAMSSLGYQTIYRLLNELPDVVAERAVLPDDIAAHDNSGTPLLTLEQQTPVGAFPVQAFSVAYELEIAGVVDCLRLSGVPVLRGDRGPQHPLIVAGGPLTFSNPAPLAPFFDIVVMGEAETTLPALLEEARGMTRERAIEAFAGRPGYYVPAADGERVPPVARADDALLPARSQIITANTELRSMFLTEAVRGCSRGCTYCVMRRSTNGGMRALAPEKVLAGIPEHARRVGLVGASVTDHPRIVDIVRGVVEGGREVGISSLRADRLGDELVSLLARGGYRTLTVAADGASEAMRRRVERRTSEKHLLRCAELARDHGLRTLKIYLMVGVPGETDDDIDELIRFTAELVKVHPRVAFGVAPFVAKRNTPLDGSPYAGIRAVEARLSRLRRGLRGRAELRPTSARWAWVEYMIAQAGSAAGLAVMDAHRAGGRFADYKRAFREREVTPTGPVARVPSTSERIALHKLGRRAPASTAASTEAQSSAS
ncbi:B12-binding domain-containing radical SAM protein [Haliangium ochraceum]|uniref:Radical SAM domain protein n=1 Tax=Haliangium ochraceum (strain DSM 14365 / JCM 11303 / SMP-2) TaxID=502025 RepID=D0LYD7_HALO1|nr:radical SAM protein [Haliangium ochraceum]ACY16287.1 Radical SAM domain protein [Haliangium ochraceum DSM 14365]